MTDKYTQHASMYIGDATAERIPRATRPTLLHVLDQNETLVETLENKPGFDAVYWGDMHHRALKDNVDTYEFTTVDTANNRAAEYLVGKNKLIVTDHRGNQFLFIIERSERVSENGQRVRRVEAYGDHYRLRTAGVIKPTTLQGATVITAAQHVLRDTEWQVGITEYSGIRTVTFDEYTNPLKALHHIASTFDIELRFRVEFDGNRIAGKYVDFLHPLEIFDGKEIVYSKDMVGIHREETTDEVYTTMVGVGPADEDGNFLTFESINNGKNYIENAEAVQRWGRHWYVYTPETEDQDMTAEQLKSLTETALRKHIESVVKYEVKAVALDRAPGYEHENVELGYHVRVKDEEFNPALYLTARVIEERRSYTDPTRDEFLFGNYVEHELSPDAMFENIQKLLFRKANRWDASTRTIRSSTAPNDTTALWVDTSQTPNVPKTYDETAQDWVKASPTVAGEVGAETPDGAQQKADAAEQNAKSYTDIVKSDLEDGIQQAQTTADGKNSVFHSPTAPPTAGRKIGDVWFDTSRDNLMHHFDGTQWVEAKWGEQSIVANSITANHIKSLVGLNVNDQFIVDSQGNVKFAGHLEGASGTFGKVSVVDGDMTLIDNTTGSETILNTGSNLLFDHSFEFIKPNVALEPVDPNNPNLASICSVDADSLKSRYGGWNNTNPSNARMVRAFDSESKHIYSGLNTIILRGQNYGIWEQMCFIPEHVRQTNALSFSAYVAPFEKTTYDVSVSLRIQLVDENGSWLQDLASTSYLIDHTKKYNWQRVSVTHKGSLNIGNNRLRVRLLLNNNTSDAMLLCDGAQLVPFKNPTLYEPDLSLFHFLNGIGTAYLMSTQHIVSDFADVQSLWAGSIEPHVHEPLPLINGWSNYGGSYVGAAYTKTADGYVHLRGLIRDGAEGTVCATLPAGCRPNGTEIFPVIVGSEQLGRITIASSGTITVTKAPSTSYLSLSGISFRAEN